MKSLKMLLFATVFALTALFTVTADAGNKAVTGDCWTPGNPNRGQTGFEDEDHLKCTAPDVPCCYIVDDNPETPEIEYSLLEKPTVQ